MADARDQSANCWAPAIRQRRRALTQRLFMGAATALVFSPVFGWSLSVGWVAVYFVIQLLDLWVFAPINSGRTERMDPLRSAVGGIMLFVNAAAFGILSVPLWLMGGAMGGVCAAILLASGAIYAVVNSPSSRRVLAITIAPQFAYLAAQPLFMMRFGAEPTFVTAAAISIGVFGAYCLSTWQRMTRASRAEAASRLQAEARQAEAEAAMASRTAFLAAVGHDLRTPISAILAGAAELERSGADTTSRSHAALITDAGHMMKALLDDLLDHSKLNAGRMTVDEADFDLRALMAQTVRLWQGPVRAKGLTIRVEGARSVPAWVRGDAMRLRQVLNNLLSNALKFTETGTITLRLRGWAEEPSGHALLIEVADTGPGMTETQLSRLFTPFDQTADGISARHGGTGLGLSISRDLVQLMGGRLTARSQPGQGATFTLSLVLQAAESQRPAIDRTAGRADRGMIVRTLSPAAPFPVTPPPAPVEPDPSPVIDTLPDADEHPEDRPLRVLVVDDHDINRRAVELILTPLGCDIASAADGLAALTLCDTDAFDVIFMDVRMPELDGRETTRRLRAGSGPNAKTPVIAVTADTAPDDIAACMAAGMTYFVSKPLTPPSLLGALSQVLAGDEADPAEQAA